MSTRRKILRYVGIRWERSYRGGGCIQQYRCIRATQSSFRAAEAQEMLRRSLDRGCASDWWYVNGSLYQVALSQSAIDGYDIVGREIDYRAVHDMGRISQ